MEGIVEEWGHQIVIVLLKMGPNVVDLMKVMKGATLTQDPVEGAHPVVRVEVVEAVPIKAVINLRVNKLHPFDRNLEPFKTVQRALSQKFQDRMAILMIEHVYRKNNDQPQRTPFRGA